jgi:2-polyprenyl-6-methoxyphenol hydroxylase-like FAD-dependent oxidoreductase
VTVDEHTQADRLDLVVGADGLHSIVAAWFLGPKTSSADSSVSVMAYTGGLPQVD